MGCRAGPVHAGAGGASTSGRPSGWAKRTSPAASIVTRNPSSCTARWCRRQSSTKLSSAVRPPPRARDALHVCRCVRFARVEQVVLVVRRGHAGDRAHLRVGDPAAAHGVAQLRQLAEGAGHPHVLAGGPRREPGAPAQPLRARQAAVPPLPLVELADEDEQLVVAAWMRADSSAMRSPSRASRLLPSPGTVAGSGGGVSAGGPPSPMRSPVPAPGVSVGPGAGAWSNDPPPSTRSGPRAQSVSVGPAGGASSGEATGVGYVWDSDVTGRLSASMNHCNLHIFNSLRRPLLDDLRPDRRSSCPGARTRRLRPEKRVVRGILAACLVSRRCLPTRLSSTKCRSSRKSAPVGGRTHRRAQPAGRSRKAVGDHGARYVKGGGEAPTRPRGGRARRGEILAIWESIPIMQECARASTRGGSARP